MPDGRRMSRAVAQDLRAAGYARHRPPRKWLAWLMPSRAGWMLEPVSGDFSGALVYFCGGGDVVAKEGGPEMRAALDLYRLALARCGWIVSPVGSQYLAVWGREGTPGA